MHSHIVILDMGMPVMNVLEAARDKSKASPNVPLIMFNLYISRQLSEQAKAVGIKEPGGRDFDRANLRKFSSAEPLRKENKREAERPGLEAEQLPCSDYQDQGECGNRDFPDEADGKGT
jgi:CheY-like chemotaxis protein